MRYLSILLLFTILLSGCKNETKKTDLYEDDVEVRDPKPAQTTSKPKIYSTTESIAYANGLKHWDKVKEIKFTFNVDRDTIHYERSWSWKPKKDLVTMTTDKDTITYNTTKIDSTNQKADQSFINDKYWLLAPFNLVWDKKSFATKHYVTSIAPISGKEMQKLTVIYRNQGGYTPGDAYDFYFEGDFVIKEWVFRQQNSEEPSLITSWEDYETFEGIKIAKTHKRNEGNWTLSFSNIEVLTE
ncbi:hypothetical protein [Aquimarina spongiae]|uniref:Uncharacterized protein n=1 Tax=Aquimarina spongiae TaxID=570521 RepID=A0A1M6KIC5_9FLAO|nr:hypothetical protein [Aquimarina spongiae]SHJ58640.1 hypothetical protein SAMN04488508_11132 [Aquimarina spongiae]